MKRFIEMNEIQISKYSNKLLVLVLFFLVSCTNTQQVLNDNLIVESLDKDEPYPLDYILNSIIYDAERGLMVKEQLEYDILVKPSSVDALNEVHYDVLYFNYFDNIQINIQAKRNTLIEILASRITHVPINSTNIFDYKEAYTNEHNIKYGIASVIINNSLVKDVIISPLAAKNMSDLSNNSRGTPIFVRFEDDQTRKILDYVFWGDNVIDDIFCFKNDYIDTPLLGLRLITDNWKQIGH